jgi:ArsR family transcriptional regulator
MQQLEQEHGKPGMPDWTVECLSRLFSSLADPTRIRIIHALADHKRLNVSELAECTNLSVSAISHQMRLLRDRYLVSSQREGRSVYYTLADEHLRTIFCTGVEHALEDCHLRQRRSRR